MGLFSAMIRNRQMEFKKGTLVEGKADLINPARGWYQIFPYNVSEELNLEKLAWTLENALVLVIFNIGAYRNEAIPEEAMRRMEAVLAYIKAQKKDAILRVVYDQEGKGYEHEPLHYQQVLSHIDQIGPLLTQYQDAIYVYQGLLVGSWGEMHTSKFLAPDQIVEMAERILSYLGEETFLALRRPVQYRYMVKASEVNERIGLFDDGILGSNTHLGTFGEQPSKIVGWNQPWERTEELSFERKVCKHAPQGGEVVTAVEGRKHMNPREIETLFSDMNLVYLNETYDKNVLDSWETIKYHGESFKKQIGKRLGYRFVVTDVNVVRVSEKRIKLVVLVKNVGLAASHQTMKGYLITDKNKTPQWFDGNLKELLSGETTELFLELDEPIAKEAWYFGVERAKNEVPVHLANRRETADGLLYLGSFTPR